MSWHKNYPPQPQAPQHHQSNGDDDNGVNFIAGAINHGINNALQSLLDQKPAEGQDSIAFINSLVSSNATLIAESIKPMEKLDISSLEDTEVEIVTKEDGSPAFEIRLPENALKYIDSVRFYLATVEDQGNVRVFGDDIDMDQDWDNGVFRDNFNGTWPALDGHLVFLETTADLEDYNYYSIPVKLNGIHAAIEALYDFKNHKYVVLGARRITAAGMPDKNLIKLKGGDKITTLFKDMNDGEEDTSDVEGETFTLGKNWSLDDADLKDGIYAYIFSMYDIQGNEALSDVSFITIKGENITYGEP